jgi:hypothetical protein
MSPTHSVYGEAAFLHPLRRPVHVTGAWLLVFSAHRRQHSARSEHSDPVRRPRDFDVCGPKSLLKLKNPVERAGFRMCNDNF